jgi:putative spermidine/putrescine transport system ATP-binding protein
VRNEPEVESSAAAAELRGVSKYYARGAVAALKAVDLTIAGGEFFTVLGPSGSGKSTLLSLLAGSERVSQGRITIAGADVTDLPPYRRNIGMVFQDYALFPHMSVFDNVYFPLKARKFGPSRGKNLGHKVREVLQTVGLEGFEDRRPAQLSGGQQQRVALARALVYEPAVLLMDEPLSSLDRQLRKQLQAELVNLHRNVATTIVFVTHDQDEAMSLSDRIAILSDGQVQQIGTPADLYQDPGSLFVATFIGDANIFAGVTTRSGLRLAGLGAEIPVPHQMGSGQTASLLIRPESVRLEPANGSAPANQIVGTVSHMSYRGSHLDVSVALADGIVVTALLGAREGPTVIPGTRVKLTWDHEAQRIVEGSQTSPYAGIANAAPSQG